MTQPAPDSISSLAALQNELGRFVVEEHALQRETMRRLWATPLAERVEDGRCIPALRVVRQSGPGVWGLGLNSIFSNRERPRRNRGELARE